MRLTKEKEYRDAKLVSSYLPEGMWVESLFDPVQTHAVYAVPKDRVAEIKSLLKKLGATYFRIVTATSGNKIVCFSSHKMFLN